MKTTLTAFVPAHKQTNPEHKPGQVVNPLGMTIQSSEKTLGEYIRRKEKIHQAFDAVKKECYGNPLRGCMGCPPTKKLTFEGWFKTRTLEFDNDGEITIRDIQIIAEEAWKLSKEN